MDQLPLVVVERIVSLVAGACDPAAQLSLPERKVKLLAGVAELISADLFMWNTAVANPERAGDVMATCLIDGGWKDAAERDGDSGRSAGRIPAPVVRASRPRERPASDTLSG
jgi:hypothetical protein